MFCPLLLQLFHTQVQPRATLSLRVLHGKDTGEILQELETVVGGFISPTLQSHISFQYVSGVAWRPGSRENMFFLLSAKQKHIWIARIFWVNFLFVPPLKLKSRFQDFHPVQRVKVCFFSFWFPKFLLISVTNEDLELSDLASSTLQTRWRNPNVSKAAMWLRRIEKLVLPSKVSVWSAQQEHSFS